MRIDSFAPQLGLNAVVRSRDFESLGYLNHDRPAMLVPFHDAGFRDQLVANARISMVIAAPGVADRVPDTLGLAVAENPMETFVKLHMRLAETGFYGASFPSVVAEDANIHATAHVDPTGVRIGRRVTIGPKAVVLARTTLEDDVSIGPGTVVGSEGFEIRRVDGRQMIVPHVGGVHIGARTTIQANTVIVRSIFGGMTEIGTETIISDLCRITHEVKIGSRCRISGTVAVSGSVTIGDEVWIGPNATISNGLRIGNRAFITLGAVVTQDVPDDGHVSGNFAIDHRKLVAFLRTIR